MTAHGAAPGVLIRFVFFPRDQSLLEHDKHWNNRRPQGEVLRSFGMELAIQIQIEELPEGLFLATSEELPGLVAQGRTVAEALEIARDVARKLIEARREREGMPNLPSTSERRDYTIVVAA